MAAAGDRCRRLAAATLLQMLLAFFACLLSPASGLRIPHPDLPDMYTDFVRDRIWYPPPVEVVAIDLGNTNSCIAGYAPAKTGLTTFQFCIPSWVAFTDDGTTLVGDAARNHAAAHPEDAVFGFKRLLGLR
jgi:heat shock protein 5